MREIVKLPLIFRRVEFVNRFKVKTFVGQIFFGLH